jgi:hypothetical protein
MSKLWRQMVGTVIAGLSAFAVGANAQTNCNASTGPDVIVGDITGPSNYASVGGIEAISLGTYSCNIGSFWLNWFSGTNQHPVIGGSLYRYRVVNGAGRFEQVGQSWLKHGFFALSNTLCCTGCQSTDGTHLGVKCSDPYTSARNGSQSGLGPKYQVNAFSGFFTYPPANPAWSGSTARRLEVAISDLATSDLYFGEAQYVTPDDAAAGNQFNNASYRPIAVTGGGTAWDFNFTSATVREKSAVTAWKTIDPSVNQTNVSMPGEGGRLILSSRVTSLGGGQWHYEYSVYNMNSDLAVNAFGIPIPAGVNATNIGFHDVDYRNGDGPGNTNYSGTDWAGAVAGGQLSWSTQSAGQNPSANAIRWATAYNFRFDCNAAPTSGLVTLGIYKTNTTFTTAGEVPGGGGPPVGTPFCLGDGSDPAVTTLCPCFNLGGPGRGCENSASTGGAQLNASGTTAPDTLVLSVNGELATVLTIFLQGDAIQVGGATFGDGIRCVGGNLKRIGVKNAVGGVANYPEVGDPSISTQSATLGDPIAPGSTRYYQTYYRDPNLGFCAAPTGDAWNSSSGQIINW